MPIAPPTLLALAAARLSRALLLALSLGMAACRKEPPLPGRPATGSTEVRGTKFIERITGGASETDPLPMIIGLHGFGGSPDRFGVALSTLSARARVILPYGFLAKGPGRSWFIDASNDAEFAEQTRRAADHLAEIIAELTRQRPTVGKVIVVGLSQGGTMSYTLAVLHPELVRAAFPVSSSLALGLVPAAWPPGKDMPRIHALHGDADRVVAIEDDRRSVLRLRALGLPVDLVEYPGVGHFMPRDMQEALTRAVAEACVE